ncbi:DUF4097 family beta strand repeat protein [Brevibacillus borstelensis]|uniref:DUF4097 domain-containing protein n=1 Tax=Brevibacillus borstelensis AK1 TaxID=1300222 RepID=M8EBE5_9BACL|nr:DUF4097 family beta strand repeat-containing protein [Brevibacillus borstelensis]EMT52820.1 hypothetical protein I532_08572 [Brevibacillus borstelensis AK1]MCC0564988.1 DUF4097 domain-containing protein [Brevibacillus borstelensis]MCM3470615.1 DUF4097 domain-containing protein [Brevibacillus borstelensis]MCM3559042.1 DUF4097 domain-containing protein [Brevibacillus borstelensis]MCM3591751.1 DUF4097 domain-containing protein [Brevibacillus borstelensis]
MRRMINVLFVFFCLLFLVGAIGFVWQFKLNPDFKGDTETVSELRTIDQPIKGVEVETDIADVVLTTSNLSSATARMVGEVDRKRLDKIKFTTEVSPDGILQVRIKEPTEMQFGFFFHQRVDLELQVMIPEAVYEKIAVNSGTGDFRINAIKAKEGTLKTSTGDIELAGFEGETLTLRTDTGDMDISSVSAKVDAFSSTGDIDSLQLKDMKHDVNVRTDTGDITVSLLKLPEAVKMELATDTGDIKADWPEMSYSEKGEQRVAGSVGTEGPALTVSSSTGDIRIRH